jgi:ribose transport system substrate-binding protein
MERALQGKEKVNLWPARRVSSTRARTEDAAMHAQRTLIGVIGLALLALIAVVVIWLSDRTSYSSPPIPEDSKGLKRIILLTNSTSPYWFACRAGLHETNKELDLAKAGFQAVMVAADGTPRGQVRKLRELGSAGDVAAVAISAIDAENAEVAGEMKALKEKGIHVITVDSDVDRDTWRDARVAFIGTDNLAAGRELGRCARALRPEGGEYATFVGRSKAQNGIDRIKGFADGAGDKFKAVANLADDQDATKARENVRKVIKDHPNVRTLVGIWSSNAPAIADVMKELKRKKDFTVVVMDADPNALVQMNDGLIDVMVVQNPWEMGFQAVRLMKALTEDDKATVKKMLPKLGQPDGDIYDTGLRVVVPDKAAAPKADLFEKRLEYFKLADFHKWLDKYTLAGS